MTRHIALQCIKVKNGTQFISGKSNTKINRERLITSTTKIMDICFT
jgi:hypothetical protein